MRRNIACILLAAGESSRQGEPSRFLSKHHGETLVHRTARELDQIDFAETIFVTGHQSEVVTAELEEFPGLKVYNPNFNRGLHSSIRAAVEKLNADIDAFFICFSDQSQFDHQILNQMICFYEGSSEKDVIIYPSHKGHQGYPVLIPASYKEEILREMDGDFGCAYLLRRHPEQVRELKLDDKTEWSPEETGPCQL